MKKLSLGMFIAVFCLVSLTVSAMAVELLSNEGFETWTAGPGGPPDNWAFSDDTLLVAAQESGTVRTGSYSVAFTCSTTYTEYLYQSVTIPVAESCYTFSCYAYDNETLGRARVGISFLAADDSTLLDSYQAPDYTTDQTSWQLLTTGSRPAPAGASYVRGEIRAYDTNWDSTTAAFTLYFDDASLERTTCPPPSDTVTIYEIQFNNSDPGGTPPDTCYPSPYDGTTKTFGGIVTHTGVADGFPDFWIQDDSDPWHGAFVFQATYEPNPGDSVMITADIIEYYGMTEMQGLSSYEVVSTGNPVPDPVDITPGDLADTYRAGCDSDVEGYESVLCKLTNVICAVDPDSSPQYAGFYVTDFNYTDTCQIDFLIYEPPAAVGDTFLSITGIVQYSRGEYDLNPRGISDVVWKNPPIPAGPGITGISWTPILPGANSVKVMVSMYDRAATIQNDSLFYQLNDTTGAWTGVSSDSSSDNFHFFTIPGQATENTLYFYAYAENDTGGISNSPIKKYTTTESDPNVRINEFMYDTPGADAGCFIELYGPPSLSLDGFEVIMVNDFDGTDKKVIDLTGETIPTDGFFVIAQDATVPDYDMIDALADFENGPDNIHLRQDGFVIDAVGYGTFLDSLYFMGETWPTYDPGFPFGFSLCRYPDGADTDHNRKDFGVYGSAYTSPGSTNVAPAEYTIKQIQDPSAKVDHTGERVIVGGIVTADPVECTDNPGYYIEMSQGGEYSGVLVYDLYYEPTRGDSVQVKGTVSEGSGLSFGRTQISYVTDCTNYGAGSMPDPHPVTTATVENGEPVEGVLIQVSDVTVLEDLGYGEFLISDGSDTCMVDDICDYTTELTVGDKFAYIRGVVDYYNSNFMIEPRDDDDFAVFAPADLEAVKSAGDVYLQWTGVDIAQSYIIVRNSINLDTVTAPTTEYLDVGATGDSGTNYYYVVQAQYAVGKSDSRQVGEFDRAIANVK